MTSEVPHDRTGTARGSASTKSVDLVSKQVRAKPKSVSRGTWVFGSLLLAFLFCVFAFAPDALPEFRLRILAVSSALLAGLFGYFLSGDIGVNFDLARKHGEREVKRGIKATGGFALFVIVLYWWFSPFALDRRY